MPPYIEDGSTEQALSAWPAYMLGTDRSVDNLGRIKRELVFETVTAGMVSRAVCLAPTSEGHGVRGFIATVIWPAGTTVGDVEVQGADLNQEPAYHILGSILFPARQYSSPSGLVTNFMRMVVKILPQPHHQLVGRLMIR